VAEDTPASVSKALLGSGVALATALFVSMGFLSTRAYLSGLGVPDHAAISFDQYVQYGARFFYVLAFDLLPISVVVGVAFVISVTLVKGSTRFDRLSRSNVFLSVLLGVVALGTVVLELRCLNPKPLFSPGQVNGLSSHVRALLYIIETGCLVAVVCLSRWAKQLWQHLRGSLGAQTFLYAVLLLVVIELLLLPLCFGRIAMTPEEFPRVTVYRDKEQPVLTGILVFSDRESYFLFTNERKLVEVAHGSVKEIQYDSIEKLDKLVHP